MRTFSMLSAVLVAVLMVGCSSTQKSDVAAGAVSSDCCAKSSECCKGEAMAAPGAVSEKAGCCASTCTKSEAAPGAMSEGCASKCSKTEAAPGAMSEPKTCPMSGCKSGSKSE